MVSAAPRYKLRTRSALVKRAYYEPIAARFCNGTLTRRIRVLAIECCGSLIPSPLAKLIGRYVRLCAAMSRYGELWPCALDLAYGPGSWHHGKSDRHLPVFNHVHNMVVACDMRCLYANSRKPVLYGEILLARPLSEASNTMSAETPYLEDPPSVKAYAHG
ncbi:hypothetical protein DAEQUDRAFT_731595 [Daedalea quercina L-15889]|uniref:Uncharacterized protein n=1 Tax=Daedalea quercina L-15889 TaxID=1314783 RepID=A0A165M7H0_9APHY|nr:hypothetical protein DAEQUDRAFT_731595 [Daedalea quercina L-15889]